MSAPVRIAIVGKYTHLCDSYISVSKVDLWKSVDVVRPPRGLRAEQAAHHRLGGGHRLGGRDEGAGTRQVPGCLGPSVRGGRYSGAGRFRQPRCGGHDQGGLLRACAEEAVPGHLFGPAGGSDELREVSVTRARDA